jgi:hypothetical protein
MDLASKILVVGGMISLAVGTLTGFFFIAERSRAEHASRYLVMTHVGMFMQGAMLLGLVFAVSLSQLSAGLESAAAAMLVISAVLAAIKDTYNWRQGVEDEFSEKPPFSRSMGALSFVLFIPGFFILMVGVVSGL